MKAVYIVAYRAARWLTHAMSDPADWFDTKVVYVPIGRYRLGLGNFLGTLLMHLSDWLLKRASRSRP